MPLALLRFTKSRMTCPFSQQFAAMRFQMSDEVPTFHPTIGSCSLITRFPASASSAKVRFASSTVQSLPEGCPEPRQASLLARSRRAVLRQNPRNPPGAILIAYPLWFFRERIANLGATRRVATASIFTHHEGNEAQLRRAFAAAKASVGVEANLDRDANGSLHDAYELSVVGDTSDRARANLAAFTKALGASFPSAENNLSVSSNDTTFPLANDASRRIGFGVRAAVVLLMLACQLLLVLQRTSKGRAAPLSSGHSLCRSRFSSFLRARCPRRPANGEFRRHRRLEVRLPAARGHDVAGAPRTLVESFAARPRLIRASLSTPLTAVATGQRTAVVDKDTSPTAVQCEEIVPGFIGDVEGEAGHECEPRPAFIRIADLDSAAVHGAAKRAAASNAAPGDGAYEHSYFFCSARGGASG